MSGCSKRTTLSLQHQNSAASVYDLVKFWAFQMEKFKQIKIIVNMMNLGTIENPVSLYQSVKS